MRIDFFGSNKAESIQLTDVTPPAGKLGDVRARTVDPTGIITPFQDGTWELMDVTGIYNVKSFGCVGDGITNDTANLQEAVTAAIAANRSLFFPTGTYLTTASIPNFHNVRKIGPGGVQRGADIFYVDPVYGQTNDLYIDPAGNNNNDGIAATTPMLTIQAAFDLLRNYRNPLEATWHIHLAAGIYGGLAAMDNRVHPNSYLHIYGPNAGGGVPTAIIDGTGVLGSAFDFNLRQNIRIQDILIRDFSAAAIYIKNFGFLITENVHIDNCLYGIHAQRNTRLYQIEGGIIENCTGYAILMQGCVSASIGLTGFFNGPTIQNCAYGIRGSEGVNAHVDNTVIDGNTNVGLWLTEESRGTSAGTTFHNNATGIRLESCSYWFDNGGNDFGLGTPDENTIRMSVEGFSTKQIAGKESHARTVEHLGGDASHTGDLLETLFYTCHSIWANTFLNPNRTLIVKIWGATQGVAGTKTLRLKIDGNTIQTAVIPANPAGAFCVEFYIRQYGAFGANTQRAMYKIELNGANPIVGWGNTAINFSTAANNVVTVTGQLGNAADTLLTRAIECMEIG